MVTGNTHELPYIASILFTHVQITPQWKSTLRVELYIYGGFSFSYFCALFFFFNSSSMFFI